MSRKVPTRNHEYLAFVKNIHEKIALYFPEWKIEQEITNQLFALDDAAQAAYQINANPEHKCKHTAAVLKYAMVDLKSFMSTFINLLLGNLNVPDDELEAMGLRPRHPGAHIPIPQPHENPALEGVTGQHHDVDFYASTIQYGQIGRAHV